MGEIDYPDYVAALADYQKIQEEGVRVAAQHQETTSGLRTGLRALESLRKDALERKLKEEGLDLCSESFSKGHDRSVILEELGLFPASTMRLHYRHVNTWRGSSYREKVPTLLLLCQNHFPEVPNKASLPGYLGTSDHGVDIWSEVIEVEGQLVSLINHSPIEVGVARYYPEGIYAYFGFQKLPPCP